MTPKSPSRQLRIIAGDWRGRRMPVPDLPGLRPTGDRVRETLFNWLDPVIKGAKVLDLFAGSGALGLEALSRQARSAVFVEHSGEALDGLRATTEAWPGIDRARFIYQDAMAWLSGPSEAFEIVFIDPPFDRQWQGHILEMLINNDWVAPNGLIYVESPKNQVLRADQMPRNLVVAKEKTVGQVQLLLVRYHTG